LILLFCYFAIFSRPSFVLGQTGIANNGGGTAEVPVLRLRQAFWLAAVVGR